MKTSKQNFSRLLSLALALLLVLSAMVPTLAAGNLTITIKNNQGLPKMYNGQFKAYQLFKGTPHKDTEPPKDKQWNAENWNNYVLADIQWGSGIKSDDLVTALKNLNYATDGEKFPEFFEAEANVFADLPDASEANAAEELARLLVGRSNDFLERFSEFIVDGKAGTGSSDGYLDTTKGTASTAVNAAAPKDDVSNITVTEAGYYLIAETSDSEHMHTSKDAISEYILAVLGDQEIDLKASAPSVTKWINAVNANKAATADIGELVTFVLEGTLPKNYGDFHSYAYTFHDTMGDGMTFDESKAALEVKVGDHTLTDGQYTVKKQADAATNLDDGCRFEVVINDLKTLGFSDITADTKLTVTYKAALNEKATLGSTGNQNAVVLEYANDLNHPASTAKSASDAVKVYTFGFDLKKVDESSNGLGGAGFVLKNADGSSYAKFKDVDNKRVFDGWVEKATVEALTAKYTEAKEKWDKASYEDQKDMTEGKAGKNLQDAVDALKDYLLTSSSEPGTLGEIPDVVGLDADTYTLSEIITPAGYNTMKDFELKVNATILESALSEFTYQANGDAVTTYNGTTNTGTYNSGLIGQELVNTKAASLPFTGGIGTLIFYVVGGAMIAGAVLYLVIIAKKRGRQENA